MSPTQQRGNFVLNLGKRTQLSRFLRKGLIKFAQVSHPVVERRGRHPQMSEEAAAAAAGYSTAEFTALA